MSFQEIYAANFCVYLQASQEARRTLEDNRQVHLQKQRDSHLNNASNIRKSDMLSSFGLLFSFWHIITSHLYYIIFKFKKQVF